MKLFKSLSQKEEQGLLPNGLILLGYRGSIAHGMYIPNTDPNSIDDKDIMGVFINLLDHYFGLRTKDHHEVFIKEWDAVSYEIKKFITLLSKGNPNVISLLWIKDEHYLYKSEIGEKLIDNREIFLSKNLYNSFIGYAYGQMHKMQKSAFNGYMGSKRKKLVDEFGYDCKMAAHCIRLLRMGIEALKSGQINVYRSDAEELLEIKKGKWSLEKVKQEANLLFKDIKTVVLNSKLPDKVDTEKVNQLCTELLCDHFYLKNTI